MSQERIFFEIIVFLVVFFVVYHALRYFLGK